MSMKKILLISALLLSSATCIAQRDYKTEYENFKQQARDKYSDFRDKCNHEYAEFIRITWETFNSNDPIPQPEEIPAPPIPRIETIPTIINPIQVPIDTVIQNPTPLVTPQPLPVTPIKETPQPTEEYFSFTFYGTPCKVRLNESNRVTIAGTDENSISKAWQYCSQPQFNNLIQDCLQLRKAMNLCDFAYLEMLNEMASSFLGKGTNEASMLMAYVYCQSGYKMRFATNGDKLCMLYASQHTIYNQSFFMIDNEAYYPYRFTSPSCRICKASFPQEQPLSLVVNKNINFASQSTAIREIKSKQYPNIKANVSVNQNLLNFYETYPASEIGNNFVSKWAMYANAPASSDVKNMLYPSLQEAIKGLSPLDAVTRILNFVQTGFDYGYDSKIWGYDRAFFADETLYYPYSDCEDRSILFSRIIRDLLGLKVILVYYPGHLATAVHFNENVKGDYISLNGEKFTVCDPTFVGAPVGATMPDFKDSSTTVILLN